MEILFLGTSSGMPTKSRNVSALVLRLAGSRAWYLVDCGEGTQHRILHTGLSLADLEGIFITHVHGDHCYGLPGLIATAGMQNRTRPLFIAGPSAVKSFLQAVIDTTALHLPYPLEYRDVERTGTLAEFADVQVQASALSHRVPSYAYSFSEKNIQAKLDASRLQRDGIAPGPAWKQLQQGKDVVLTNGRRLQAADYRLPARKPRQIIIAGDNDTPALLAEAVVDADVLVHEATYTEAVSDKMGPSPMHSSAKKVAQFAQQASLPNLILTHFSPRYHGSGDALAALEAEARQYYSGNLFLARDWDHYSLDPQGQLRQLMSSLLSQA